MEAGAPGWELAVSGLAQQVRGGQQIPAQSVSICSAAARQLCTGGSKERRAGEVPHSFEWKLSILLECFSSIVFHTAGLACSLAAVLLLCATCIYI